MGCNFNLKKLRNLHPVPEGQNIGNKNNKSFTSAAGAGYEHVL